MKKVFHTKDKNGQIKTGEDILNKWNALRVWNTVSIEADNSSILFIEVPMN